MLNAHTRTRTSNNRYKGFFGVDCAISHTPTRKLNHKGYVFQTITKTREVYQHGRT
jgi:hypothetical protein